MNEWRKELSEKDATLVASVENRKKRGFTQYGHEALCFLLIDILDRYGKLQEERDGAGEEKPPRRHRETSGSL